MRIVVLVGLLALSGCTSEHAGRAFGGFAKSFERASKDVKPLPPSQPQIPMQPPAQAAMPAGSLAAIYTGQSRQIRTVTGAPGWECQYRYNGQTFLLIFDTFCPQLAAIR